MPEFDKTDTLRRVAIRPYRPGLGPIFELLLWSTGKVDARGQSILGYQLDAFDAPGSERRTIFEAEDFAGSPMDADDSDATVDALLTFLTLRPGDTDLEYFDRYTPAQLEFCEQHAEALAAYAYDRFNRPRQR